MAASIMAFVIAILLLSGYLANGEMRYPMGGWPAPYGIELHVDAFAILMLLIVTGASTVALAIARTSVNAEVPADRQHLFYAAWLLTVAGLCGIVVAGDAFNVFVFMEVSSLATYILIAGGPKRQAFTAAFKYLIMGTIGATFYLIGVGLVYMMTGTLNLADMEQRLAEVTDLKPILVAGGFITVGLALKAAVFPLHFWLPNAYRFAPHAVTVFLAACSTKVAIYVLLRFDFFVFQNNLANHDLQFAGFFLPLAVLGIVIGSAVALFERDLKRLLAYSSIAQLGYVLLGAALVSVGGLTAGILHLFNHALAKGALFAGVACLASRLPALSLANLAGAGRRMPLTMAGFLLAGLSLIGVPGTAGFISKWYLIVAALDHGAWGAAIIVLVLAGSLMALAYVWRIVEVAYFDDAPVGAHLGEAPWEMRAPLWVLALAGVYFGLQPQLPLALSLDAAAALLSHVP
ncbi:MAG: monovalent cation/H+ antiporter subunit D family protein [Gammaproteobacteria bacterium]|nr:monovalent cation/H+ antiporter subunit D family protein [Gammaproteobacteria bacterium]